MGNSKQIELNKTKINDKIIVYLVLQWNLTQKTLSIVPICSHQDLYIPRLYLFQLIPI